MADYQFLRNIVQHQIPKKMDNPWELKITTVRTSDTLFVFHLFCEDRNGEPLYFEQFENHKVKIISHKQQGSMFKNLVKTITKCKEDGFLKRQGN